MEKFVYFIAMGFTGAYIAKKRKLNPFLGFAICSFGLLALISFIFLPFFLKKWKKKPIPVQKVAAEPLFPLETIWYYLDDEETQVGPMSFARLLEVKKEGAIQENNYIWNENFNEWKLWRSVFSADYS